MSFIHFDHAGEAPQEGLSLVSMSGVEAISELFQYNLVLKSELDTNIDPGDFIGQEISFALDYFNLFVSDSDRKTRFVHGVVTSFRIDETQSDLGVRQYTVEIVPAFWFLTKSSHFKIFESMKSSDIISDILGEYGIASFVKSTNEERVHCVQYFETDYDFILRLMQDEGLIYYFEHTESEHKLHITDATTFLESGKMDVGLDVVTSWSPTFRFITGKWIAGDYSYIKKSEAMESNKVSDVKGLDNAKHSHLLNVGDTFGEAKTSVVKRRVEVLKGQEDASYEVIEVSSEKNNICAGASFDLQDSELIPNGTPKKLLVIEAAHSMNIEARYSNNFSCVSTERGYWGKETITRPFAYGPMTAIVSDDIDPDELGRVQVSFDQFTSDAVPVWIRVAQIMAGENIGAVFTPRIGDEVVITFINGNPDRPLITGSLYNGSNKVPKNSEDIAFSPTRNGIITPSTELYFEDESGNELLHVRANKDYERIVVENELLKIDGDRTIEIKGLEKKTVEGDVTLESSKNIKMTAKSDVEVSSSANIKLSAKSKIELKVGGNTFTMDTSGITLKVGGNSIKMDQAGITIKGIKVKVEGSAMAELKAPKATVSGDAMVEVKGGVVMIN